MASARVCMLPTVEGDVPARWYEEVSRGTIGEVYDFLEVPKWKRRHPGYSLVDFLPPEHKAVLHIDETISIVKKIQGEEECPTQKQFPRRGS